MGSGLGVDEKVIGLERHAENSARSASHRVRV